MNHMNRKTYLKQNNNPTQQDQMQKFRLAIH